MPVSSDTISTAQMPRLSGIEHLSLSKTQWCREEDAPWSAQEQMLCSAHRAYYIKGMEPTERTHLPGYDSGVMTLVLAVFLFIIVNVRHYSTYLKSFHNNLFSTREQENAFDEKNTISELRVQLSLIILTCLCEGIFIYAFLASSGYAITPFHGIGILSAVAGIYYVWQLMAYYIVGNTFTSTKRASMWVKGFNASQSLLGILLTIPAMVALFNPHLWHLLCIIAATLYVLARLIFIIKGFRIFYDNSLGLIYFILYLCSLEIIPLIWLYKASLFALQYI